VAFVGRDNTRLFGEQTAGYTVGNSSYLLWDGTHLALADGAYVDRNGTVYTEGVPPDVAVTNDWATFRTADDPVIGAAAAWLQQQPGCTESATPT
jgi:C-terminal processing protease CtpA/Prc